MLFAQPFTSWFPWVLLAIAISALLALAVRFTLMYRDMKREKAQRKKISETAALLHIDGEYFVLSALCLYEVGKQKQLGEGAYLLKTSDGNAISLQLNGVVVDYNDGETLQLSDGDKLRAEKDVKIKPVAQQE